MCKQAVTRTSQPAVTNTNLDWNGLKQNDFILRIEIQSGFAGRESARISARKLPHRLHFDARWGGSVRLSPSFGPRKGVCALCVFARGSDARRPASHLLAGRT